MVTTDAQEWRAQPVGATWSTTAPAGATKWRPVRPGAWSWAAPAHSMRWGTP